MTVSTDFDRPIEEVHLLARDREPTASHDPRAPATHLSHLCSARIVDQTLRGLEHALSVESGALAEVEADVIVRGRMRGACRPRAPKRDRDDSWDRGENS
jgi:hypothetical protein